MIRTPPPALARRAQFLLTLLLALSLPHAALAQEYKTSNKPPLHGTHWVAITGKPLAASAGTIVFNQGGNAVDAACAMLAAAATMWDTLSWGGETQALIHDPRSGKVFAINALGAAPSGATPEYFRDKLHMPYPPEYGPLAAITPGTPGGLMVMLSRFGTMSLEQVLAPAMEMARGYPMEATQARQVAAAEALIRTWPDTRRVMLPHYDAASPRTRGAPRAGEIFRQPELLATLTKLVQAERDARAKGASREDAIMAAYERFYRGDIARELTRAVQAAGGLITMQDLDRWQVHVEQPVSTRYKDIDVYKLNSWVQGPVLLQMLNLLEGFDLRKMGYNSPRYIHTLYQAMNLAYADRDFYYGDPYFPPKEPIAGLLSKEYARQRAATMPTDRNDPTVRPGDPYPFQGERNPFDKVLKDWKILRPTKTVASVPFGFDREQALRAGTTSVQAADAAGWVVSITPSGGWIPAFIAGNTGVGLSQRMQSFDMDASRNPFNVMEPGKRPRATLSPSLALRNGKPFLSFAVQGGDFQDQNMLQFFLNVVEFGMDPQQASEAANMGSYQLHSSFDEHVSEPGKLLLRADTPQQTQARLAGMGYEIVLEGKTSGPINGIYFDQQQGSMIGGSSDYGDDYGVAW
ncbi:MAG: gamma-glutamyltransferase [Nevskiaceae bacterium]|jgi:gamma-glutamyltranspeptidase/glutathione hydrolase|nr:gamma-glutamyltransferase [Nevskiaceae bacterium]